MPCITTSYTKEDGETRVTNPTRVTTTIISFNLDIVNSSTKSADKYIPGSSDSASWFISSRLQLHKEISCVTHR